MINYRKFNSNSCCHQIFLFHVCLHLEINDSATVLRISVVTIVGVVSPDEVGRGQSLDFKGLQSLVVLKIVSVRRLPTLAELSL